MFEKDKVNREYGKNEGMKYGIIGSRTAMRSSTCRVEVVDLGMDASKFITACRRRHRWPTANSRHAAIGPASRQAQR